MTESLPDYISQANSRLFELQLNDSLQIFIDERGYIVNKQAQILGSLTDPSKSLHSHKLSIARYITMLITNGVI